MNSIVIHEQKYRNNEVLLTLEALFIKELKLYLNTKEDFKNEELRLQILMEFLESFPKEEKRGPQSLSLIASHATQY